MQLVCIKGGTVFLNTFAYQMMFDRVVYCLPNYLHYIMDGLTGALSHCKAGCYITEQCMNHIMYADDICVMAPTTIALQKWLDMCFEYSIAYDLIFNPVKSVCIIIEPCLFKLYCPTVSIRTEPLKYVNTVKYLGFIFCKTRKIMRIC